MFHLIQRKLDEYLLDVHVNILWVVLEFQGRNQSDRPGKEDEGKRIFVVDAFPLDAAKDCECGFWPVNLSVLRSCIGETSSPVSPFRPSPILLE